MTKPRVIVSGLPHSGNRLIIRMLKEHGARVTLLHFGGENRDWAADPNRRVIIPIRAEREQQLSFERSFEQEPNGVPRDYGAQCALHYDTLRMFAGVPILSVSYEALVRDPQAVGRGIVEFCSLEWAGWPEPIYDGNAEWV